MLTLIEAKALKDLWIQPNDLLAGKAQLLLGVSVIALEGKSLFHSFINDDLEPRPIGITELLVERAQDLLRALDQIFVVQDQVSGRGMRVQIFQGMAVPVLCKIYNLIQIKPFFLGISEYASCIVDP